MLYDTSAVQPIQSIQPIQPIQPMQPIQPIQSIQSIQSIKPTQPTQSIQPTQPTKPNDSRFRPALNQDPLFWCLYVMLHGIFKYEQVANKFTAEQDGKRDQVLLLRERAKSLKHSTGIKFSASSLEGDITSPRISLHAFQVLVHLNSLNAVFVNPANRVYAEFISDAVSDKPVYVIERNDKNPKCMTMILPNINHEITSSRLALVRASNYRIENLQKPIKSTSAYTVAELTEMCHQLKIQLKPKMKKQELYDAVSSQFVL